MDKSKILILKGAGFFPKELSTSSITEKLRTQRVNGIKINGLLPGEYFYRKLGFNYTRKRSSFDYDINLVNFETILHLLEELYSFYTSKTKGIPVKNPEYKGVKPVLFRAKSEIAKDLVKANKGKKGMANFIRKICYEFINAIIEEVSSYENSGNHHNVNEFENFIKDKLPDNNWIKRIYTLNYDNLLKEKVDYFDGFDKKGNFLQGEVLENNNNCHYNLHGSIYWQASLNKIKVCKDNAPVNVKTQITSSDYDINREPILATPFISGYNKSQRMKFSPYLQLYYAFQRDILDSDLILIIGYGFNDVHVNNILGLNKAKSIIVTYFDNWVNSEDNEKDTFDDNILHYLQNKISLNSNGFHDGVGLIRKPWIESNNKNVKVWWKGINKEFYNNWDKITK